MPEWKIKMAEQPKSGASGTISHLSLILSNSPIPGFDLFDLFDF